MALSLSTKYIATKPLHHTPHCTNPTNNLLNLLLSYKPLSSDNSKAPHKQLTTSLLSVTQGSMNSRYAKYCFTADSVSNYWPSAYLSHCALTSHLHIFKWHIPSRQHANPPGKHHLHFWFELELIVVCLQAKCPINSLLPSHQHVRLPWVLFYS